MTDATKTKAAAELAQIKALTEVILPDPAEPVVPLDQAEPEQADEIRKRMAEIDLSNSGSVLGFGARAQTELQQISQSMLADVRNKDIGPAGDSLRTIVTTIRGFSISELDVRRKRSFWEKLTGKAAPMARFVARYEKVQGQIDDITDNLLSHEHNLMKDIKSLDLLYEKTLEFYDELGLYISAGDEMLGQLDAQEIPALERRAAEASDQDGVLRAQDLRDLRSLRDDLERRVHDLRLTRQVTMQSLPSIRMVQENDKSLVTKINSTLVNTVPLWETQLAQAVTIQRSAEAAASVRAANDLTNDLLKANAKNLREANSAVRTELERGVFDIEAVRQANEDLVGAIEESLSIAEAGKAQRKAAETELVQMETKLRDTLSRAKAGAPSK